MAKCSGEGYAMNLLPRLMHLKQEDACGGIQGLESSTVFPVSAALTTVRPNFGANSSMKS